MTVVSALTVLRSPPFPGIPASVAAVSVPATEDTAPADPAALIAAIRTARVGGAFWAARPVLAPGRTIIRPVTAEAAMALVSRDPTDLLVLLPDTAWANRPAAALRAAGLVVVRGDIDPWHLLDHATHVEVAGDDELALLARIAGVPVTCTGGGRFAGEAPVEAVVAEALIAATRYRDCFTGETIDAFAAIAILVEWRRLIEANRKVAVAAGIAIWKRHEVARLLWNGTAMPRFARTTERAMRIAQATGGAIAAWPSRIPAGMPATARASGIPFHRVEDGFIRSVGLGSNLHPPLSIVVDSQGIYYDPHRPSDLETILADHPFDDALRARARRLSETIVRAGISKYSSGHQPFRVETAKSRVVLVVGQVEDDLSVRLGGGDVVGNRDLLARARAAEPDACVLFKPHPDVDAGHRAGRIDDREALRFADRVVRDVPMPALLDAVDGIHVLTSLAGYEALLRGRDVTVHGTPFYAGWGLTRDLGPAMPRRTRRLDIDSLTAAALILYPRYLDPLTNLPCPPEILVHRLASQARPRETMLIRARRFQGWLRRPHSPIGRLA